MQSWMALLVAGMLLGPVAGAPLASAESPSVSPEAQAAVDAGYTAWQQNLGSRAGCSAGVSIVYESLSGRRGEYRTGSSQVVIDPYDQVAGMAAIVAHELSHHTFLACGAFADSEFTAAFYAVQELPAGRDWFDYSAGWSGTPAEHFAEVMAVTVAGSGEGGIPISDEAVALMARWLAGAPLTAPTPAHDPVPYAIAAEVPAPATTGGGVTQPSPAPPTSQPEPDPVSVEILNEVLEVFLPSTGAFWLNTWRVIGPI